MPFPVPPFNPQAAERKTPPAIVRVVSLEDVLWNKPVFRAPPLVVTPPAVPAFPADLIGPTQPTR